MLKKNCWYATDILKIVKQFQIFDFIGSEGIYWNLKNYGSLPFTYIHGKAFIEVVAINLIFKNVFLRHVCAAPEKNNNSITRIINIIAYSTGFNLRGCSF